MRSNDAQYIRMNDSFSADCVRGMKDVNDAFDEKAKAHALVTKVHGLLLWAGAAPNVGLTFWIKLKELSDTYDDIYGGHEELT